MQHLGEMVLTRCDMKDELLRELLHDEIYLRERLVLGKDMQIDDSLNRDLGPEDLGVSLSPQSVDSIFLSRTIM